MRTGQRAALPSHAQQSPHSLEGQAGSSQTQGIESTCAKQTEPLSLPPGSGEQRVRPACTRDEVRGVSGSRIPCQWREPGWYLQEVLAGRNERKLSAGAIWLGLASSHTLYQHRDLIRHHLQPDRRVNQWGAQSGQWDRERGGHE